MGSQPTGLSLLGSQGQTLRWVGDALCLDYPERRDWINSALTIWMRGKGSCASLLWEQTSDFVILHIFQTFTPSLAGFCVCLQWWAVVMKSKRYSSLERSPHWLKIRCFSFLCHIDFAGSSPWFIQGWAHDQTFILVILSSLSPVSCSLILLLMTGLLDGISHSRWKVSLD